eukprot:CAMPEP_0115288464 /NCGR_PEP_ID=MMETSP0270-20121206/62987_1 /TAXON_ID=71861 /ORGANISM="Scrippsiella trochoidea, Strain CCMP3099" /LENGTH=130 /DNA_ID=CAMNT_0002705573 /DNA_START=1004 /DNA_END=1396 /DNA_ORIENTATION=-
MTLSRTSKEESPTCCPPPSGPPPYIHRRSDLQTGAWASSETPSAPGPRDQLAAEQGLSGATGATTKVLLSFFCWRTLATMPPKYPSPSLDAPWMVMIADVTAVAPGGKLVSTGTNESPVSGTACALPGCN